MMISETNHWTCHGCGLVCTAPATRYDADHRCPRCVAPIHHRIPNSLNRSAALLVAATLLYIPANAFPIMTVKKLGKGDPHTILSGVQELAESGLWSLAILVLFASVVVPMLKLVGLSFLVWMAKRRSTWRLQDRSKLYRVIEVAGRWSMIDIFVIAILVALVHLGTVATIQPGAIGATSFAAVVVLTMFAASSFDPRLMWDAVEDSHVQQ